MYRKTVSKVCDFSTRNLIPSSSFSELESLAVLSLIVQTYRVGITDAVQHAGETADQRRERILEVDAMSLTSDSQMQEVSFDFLQKAITIVLRLSDKSGASMNASCIGSISICKWYIL